MPCRNRVDGNWNDQEPDPAFAAAIRRVIHTLDGVDWDAYEAARTELWALAIVH